MTINFENHQAKYHDVIVHQERNVFSLVASSQSVGKTGQNNATVEEFAWNVMICQTRRCLEAAALAR